MLYTLLLILVSQDEYSAVWLNEYADAYASACYTNDWHAARDSIQMKFAEYFDSLHKTQTRPSAQSRTVRTARTGTTAVRKTKSTQVQSPDTSEGATSALLSSVNPDVTTPTVSALDGIDTQGSTAPTQNGK